MIITKLQGGLGNQMFQYAAGKALALKYNVELLLETSQFSSHDGKIEQRELGLRAFVGVDELEVNDNNPSDIAKYPLLKEKFIDKILPRHKRGIYKEPHFHYDNNFLQSKKKQYLKGFWQSEKYFDNSKPAIKSIFQLKGKFVHRLLEEKKNNDLQQTVSIHIRRGDYVNNPETSEWHGVLPKEYYLSAFSLLTHKHSIDRVLYFSDDPEWVIKELQPLIPGDIASGLLTFNQYEDFYLMQHCKHNIIANSSFSWWAAYLNPNPNKMVIAPKQWFNKAPFNTKDLYPTGWIKV